MKNAILKGAGSLCLALAVSAAPALAADMYPATGGSMKDSVLPAGWTGFYVGVNGGYGWSQYADQLADMPWGLPGSSPSGGFGGAQLGYNVQNGQLVYGIEADIQGSAIGGKHEGNGGTGYYTNSSLDWFGTVRGRAGLVLGNSLIYGTGGFAYGSIHNRVDYSSLWPGDIYDIRATATGYTAGGGMEFKVAPAWSLKAEYQYINLGINDPVRPGVGTYGSFASAGTVLRDDAFHTVRLGLNYHPGQSYEPLK